MAAGTTTFSGISTLVADVYEGALFTLRAQNLLARTVTVFTDQVGWNPRKITTYPAANVQSVAEGAEVSAPTKFDRTLLATLSPARYTDQFLITDQRVRTDPLNVRDDAARELGSAFASFVDIEIAKNFNDLTGGTVGTAGGTLTWATIFKARAKLHQAKIPGPYYCALGSGHWYHLLASAMSNGTSAEITNAPQFQDALINSYFVSSLLGGVVFVITPNIENGGGTAGYGAMYNPLAMAYDQRLPFTIEPERDASRMSWELNANLEFVTDTWALDRGITIVGTDVIP